MNTDNSECKTYEEPCTQSTYLKTYGFLKNSVVCSDLSTLPLLGLFAFHHPQEGWQLAQLVGQHRKTLRYKVVRPSRYMGSRYIREDGRYLGIYDLKRPKTETLIKPLVKTAPCIRILKHA
jgi:hypothetical protein